MDIILLPGLWLPASIWSNTASELDRLGHRPTAVQLPGVDDASASATLDDQVAAVVAAVDDVEHWSRLRRLLLYYADFFSTTNGRMPFPGWEPFEGPDSADLNDADREPCERRDPGSRRCFQRHCRTGRRTPLRCPRRRRVPRVQPRRCTRLG